MYIYIYIYVIFAKGPKILPQRDYKSYEERKG